MAVMVPRVNIHVRPSDGYLTLVWKNAVFQNVKVQKNRVEKKKRSEIDHFNADATFLFSFFRLASCHK